jgi:hypothetical protein
MFKIIRAGFLSMFLFSEYYISCAMLDMDPHGNFKLHHQNCKCPSPEDDEPDELDILNMLNPSDHFIVYISLNSAKS